MMNKKKILIETLHGSVAQLNELSSMTEGIDIYDETGHVDTKFLMEALSCVNTFVNASNIVVQKISSLLAPDASTDEKKKQADEGKKWNVEEILKHCTLENNILKLPQVQFNKKSYAEAKKWIEEAGGSWQGGKIQGFTFPFNPERVFSILKEGKRCDLQKDFQFFETPADIADWLVMLAGGIHETDTVLEPSAGRGALIKAIHRSCPSVTVECYELMPENREFLHTLDNVILLDEDFTKDSVGHYTKIIANPPFSGNQDIDHVRLMYERLEEGGILAAITSQHWKFASEKKCVEFREWLEKVHGGLIGAANAEKDGLMGKEYAIRSTQNAGLSINYDVNGTTFYSTTSLIELLLYSTGSVAYYRILVTPNKNIIIRYLGNNDCDFKLNGNILYVLPRHTDISIRYKMGLYRGNIPGFDTVSISDFTNITGDIITPTEE